MKDASSPNIFDLKSEGEFRLKVYLYRLILMFLMFLMDCHNYINISVHLYFLWASPGVKSILTPISLSSKNNPSKYAKSFRFSRNFKLALTSNNIQASIASFSYFGG